MNSLREGITEPFSDTMLDSYPGHGLFELLILFFRPRFPFSESFSSVVLEIHTTVGQRAVPDDRPKGVIRVLSFPFSPLPPCAPSLDVSSSSTPPYIAFFKEGWNFTRPSALVIGRHSFPSFSSRTFQFFVIFHHFPFYECQEGTRTCPLIIGSFYCFCGSPFLLPLFVTIYAPLQVQSPSLVAPPQVPPPF